MSEKGELVVLGCRDPDYEVMHSNYSLLCFGDADLQISLDCGATADSRSDLGASYELPAGITAQSEEASTYLAGEKMF